MAKEGKIHLVKYAPPPPDLPVYQHVDPREISFIGRTNYEAPLESKKYIFGIKRIDRSRHVYIVGKAGAGKSKLLELFMRQDIAYGHGLCFIDPHGDTINSILDFIPDKRRDDIVLVDPTDAKSPISFNPLRNVPDEMKAQVVQGITEIIQRVFGSDWSSRHEHVFRYTLFALLDYPEATLHGMIEILTDDQYRARVVPYITDGLVRRFFEVEFDEWARKFETDAILPLVNKIGHILSVPMLRNILSQKENRINIDACMAEKKIVLINLAKRKIGDENARFFGSLFINRIRFAGVTRADMPQQARPDFYLYIDEFQNLATPSFVALFSEAREYGINLTVAHQYTAQLAPDVLAAVLGNASHIIIFRVGGEDAVKLEPEMAPVFRAKDMINLGTREFYIKETIDGETYDPFSAETLTVLPPPHPSLREQIMEQSRKKYGVGEAKRDATAS